MRYVYKITAVREMGLDFEEKYSELIVAANEKNAKDVFDFKHAAEGFTIQQIEFRYKKID